MKCFNVYRPSLGVFSLVNFTWHQAEPGRLSFIPSTECYNAGEEFIEEAIEILRNSVQKKKKNFEDMEKLYKKHCRTKENIEIEMMITTTVTTTKTKVIESIETWTSSPSPNMPNRTTNLESSTTTSQGDVSTQTLNSCRRKA